MHVWTKQTASVRPRRDYQVLSVSNDLTTGEVNGGGIDHTRCNACRWAIAECVSRVRSGKGRHVNGSNGRVRSYASPPLKITTKRQLQPATHNGKIRYEYSAGPHCWTLPDRHIQNYAAEHCLRPPPEVSGRDPTSRNVRLGPHLPIRLLL